MSIVGPVQMNRNDMVNFACVRQRCLALGAFELLIGSNAPSFIEMSRSANNKWRIQQITTKKRGFQQPATFLPS